MLQPLYNRLSPPFTLQIYLPKLKMKLKGLHFADIAEIKEAKTDELRRSKKRKFRQLFTNCTTTQKPVYMPMELIFK